MSPQTVLPIVIPIAVVGLILWRNRRPRPLRPERMWIAPLFIIAAIGSGLYFTPHEPFGPTAWVGFALAAGLGMAAGWWRGKTVSITPHADGKLYAQSTPIGLILIGVLLAFRSALRLLIEREGAAWHVNAGAVADAFLVFALALVLTQRLEMWLRARRLPATQETPAVA